MIVKFWSDPQCVRNLCDVRPILTPFFGYFKDETDPDCGRFDEWQNDAFKIFKLTNLEECDAVIYPQDPTIDPKGFKYFQKITENKPLIVFFNSDIDTEIDVRKNSLIFRTSRNRSERHHNEFGLAVWSKDYGQFKNRPWNKKPSVGFCGQNTIPPIRNIGLSILEKNKNINTNFIKHNNFWGGRFSLEKNSSKEIVNIRENFLNNIKNSDYIFCARGGGNFSYRLCETLMCGRIPLVIDTDCLFPECINNDFFPIVNSNEIENIGNILLNFHNFIEDDFETLQNNLRKFWIENLSPTGFFKYVANKIKTYFNINA